MIAVQETCLRLHAVINSLEAYPLPSDATLLPKNGVYFLFERGEFGHGGMRIVRVGSHTGNDKLPSRLGEHTAKNKDRSIFRKNIGRALLNKTHDPFLEQWNFDLTSRNNQNQYGPLVDMERQQEIEKAVSDYLIGNLTFSVIQIEGKIERLYFEKRAIATVAQCSCCHPSEEWLGLFSPVPSIRVSGLWLKQHLGGEPLRHADFTRIEAKPE